MSETEKRSADGGLPADDLIEIHDPEIDPAQIMAEIRERIQRRRAELGYYSQRFISFAGAQFPDRPDDVPYDPDFYDHLEMANELYAKVETKVDLQPSPATRVPILGNLWKIIREQAHGLAIFYVNRAIMHQANVNRELIGVLNRTAIINLEQQRKLMELQAEVEALRAEITQ